MTTIATTMDTVVVKRQPAVPGKPILLKGLEGVSKRAGADPARPSHWRIYATLKGLRCAKTHFIKQGYKYFVAWKDVNGHGLEAEWRAAWQNDASPVYQDL